MTTEEIKQQTEQYVLHTYNRFPIVIEKGEGDFVYDTDGKKYLDFGAGIAVFALGYHFPGFDEALKAQIDRVIHTSNLYYHVPLAEAAKAAVTSAEMSKIFFTNSGTEAIEGALKAARKYAYDRDGTADHEIIAMKNSFHGRTIGALSVTGNDHYQAAFRPLMGGVKFADFNDLESVKSQISSKTCAVIMETVQGEGGIYPAEKEFLEGVRALCDEHDMIILILIGIVPSVIAATVVVRGYVDRAVSLRSINVKNQCDILCNTLVTEKYVSNTNNDVINSELALLSNIYSGRIVIVDSDYKVVKDTYDLDTGKTSVSRDIISCANGNGGTTLYDSDNNYIQIVVPIQDPDTKVIEGVMLASVSTNEIDQNVRILENEGLLVIIIISLLVFIIGYFLAGILVKPFRTVTRAIEDVTDGYEEERISVPDYTETEQITDAFNKMLTRVKTVDNSRNEFVSNVSHDRGCDPLPAGNAFYGCLLRVSFGNRHGRPDGRHYFRAPGHFPGCPDPADVHRKNRQHEHLPCGQE